MAVHEMSSEVVTAVLTLLGTVFAGVGLKVVDSWLSRSSNKAKVDSELRQEYRDTINDKRTDITELKEDLDRAKKEIDDLEEEIARWRERYYEEISARVELVARLRFLEERFKNE